MSSPQHFRSADLAEADFPRRRNPAWMWLAMPVLAVAIGLGRTAHLSAAKTPPKPEPIAALEAVERRIDLNTATLQQLDTLPGIGPVTARAIVAGRPYAAVEDLLRLHGFKRARLEKILPYVAVE